jgi:hypothetical protein
MPGLTGRRAVIILLVTWGLGAVSWVEVGGAVVLSGSSDDRAAIFTLVVVTNRALSIKSIAEDVFTVMTLPMCGLRHLEIVVEIPDFVRDVFSIN